jgi:hypothetical protein
MPFDGGVPRRKARLVDPDKAWVRRAGMLFRELTGKKAVDDFAAWRVFFEALQASAFPTTARRAWLIKTAKPWLQMSPDARMADVLPRVKLALGGPAPGMPFDEAAKPRNNRIRSSLAWLDERFASAKLSDNAITDALTRPEGQIAAALSLACGAFDHKRKRGESEAAALKRIATAYRMATRRAQTETRNKK